MTAIIAIFALAGLIWGGILMARGSLLAGCGVYLILASCMGGYFMQFDVGGVTLSLDRLFLLALAGAFVMQWRLARTTPKPIERIDFFLLGLLAVLTVSTFLHDWRSTSLHDVPVIQHLINGYFIPFSIYWIARHAVLTKQHVGWLLGLLTVFGVYLALTGIFESLGVWALVWPRYIANPELGLHFGRARGPMLHSVSYGFYLTACLFAAWIWRERLPKYGQFAVYTLLPLFFAAIYLTKTRTIWLGAASGVGVLVLGTLNGRTRTLVMGGMLAAGLLVGVTKMDSIVGLQREGTVQDTRKSASMRKSFAYVSWLMFLDRPVFGFGFGQFAEEKLAYLGDRSVDLQLESIRAYVHHNTFLSLLTETGVIGLALFLAVYIGWTIHAWRLARCSLAPDWAQRQGWLLLAVLSSLFWQMVGHEITFTPLDHSIVFLLAGVAVSLHAEFRAPAPNRLSQRFAGYSLLTSGLLARPSSETKATS